MARGPWIGLAIVVLVSAAFAGGRWSAPTVADDPAPAPRAARPPSEPAAWRGALDRARQSPHAAGLRADALDAIDTADGDVALGDAVRLLGWVGQEEDHDLLVAFMATREPALEQPAIEALGRLGTDRAVDTLIAALDDPQRDVALVLTALGASGHPRAAEVMAERLNDPTLNWAAARGLAQMATPYAVDQLSAALRRANPNTAGEIARALGSLADDVPSASTALHAVLSGPRSPVRMSALSALAAAKDPAVYDLLMADLEQPGPGAGQIIMALGELGDPRAAPRLAREAVEGTPEVRQTALSALAAMDQPESNAALLRLVQTATGTIAAGAVYALPDLDRPEVQKALVLATKDRPREVRQAALQRLLSNPWRAGEVPPAVLELARVELRNSSWNSWGIDPVGLLLQHGERSDWALVEDALINGPVQVRTAAVWSLQALNHSEANRLITMLADDPDPNVRQAALSVMMQQGQLDEVEQRLIDSLAEGRADYGGTEMLLMQLGTARATETLLRRAETGTQREAYAAVSALANGGDRELLTRLLRLADTTKDPQLSTQILQTLSYTEVLPPEVLIDRLLASKDPNVQATATTALLRAGTPEAKERLIAMTMSDDPQVSTAALGSLAQLGGPEAERALIDALDHPDAQWVAVSSLQSMGTQSAREALLLAAKDAENPQLRANIISQVGSYGGEENQDLLNDALRDEAVDVRGAAIGALESLGTTAAGEMLGRELRSGQLDPDEATRVAMALERMGGQVAATYAREIEASRPPEIDTGGGGRP
jgi:HEAT repeat protein